MTSTELVYRLLGAAGRVCDLYDDGEQARVDMRADVLATLPHLRADLLDHFTALQKLHSLSAGCRSGFHAGFHRNRDVEVETAAEISAAALDDDSPSFGASITPFMGPPGDPSSTGNSRRALSLFRNQPRGVM